MGRPRGDTREKLVRGAFEALSTLGYAGASSRAIGRLANVNPALVFYYFESVDDLLVTALAESSASRLIRHREAVESATGVADLLEVLRRIYRDDVASGHLAAASELIAASVSRPALAPRVAALMEPWVDLAESGVARVLEASTLAGVVSVRSVARAAVVFYLGANLFSRLGPHGDEIELLFEDGARLAALFDGAVGRG
jgi:AcrR family transcriptional regulator